MGAKVGHEGGWNLCVLYNNPADSQQSSGITLFMHRRTLHRYATWPG